LFKASSFYSWPGGLMVRRCFPVAKIAGSSPVWVGATLGSDP
jgi:hypothetical protein